MGSSVSISRIGKYSRLSLSRPKGLSEILRDICTLTYQICQIEVKKK